MSKWPSQKELSRHHTLGALGSLGRQDAPPGNHTELLVRQKEAPPIMTHMQSICSANDYANVPPCALLFLLSPIMT